MGCGTHSFMVLNGGFIIAIPILYLWKVFLGKLMGIYGECGFPSLAWPGLARFVF